MPPYAGHGGSAQAEYAAAHAEYAAAQQAAAHSQFAAAQAAGHMQAVAQAAGHMGNHSPPPAALSHGVWGVPPRPQPMMPPHPIPNPQPHRLDLPMVSSAPMGSAPMPPPPLVHVPVPAPAPAAVLAKIPAAQDNGQSHPDLIGMLESQVSHSASLQRELLAQQDQHQQQLLMMHEKLANIERMQQTPNGLDGAAALAAIPTDTDGGSEVEIWPLPMLDPHNLPSSTSPEVDDAFGTDVFEQCYTVHMGVYGAGIVMALSLKYTSRACDGLVQYLLNTFLLTFVLCFASRWVYHKKHQEDQLHVALAQVSGAAVSLDDVKTARSETKARLTLVLCLSLLALSLFSLHIGISWKSSDLCRIGGSAADIWETLMPTWYAHAGTLDMLTGLMLTTHNLGARNLLFLGGASRVGFIFGHLLSVLPAADASVGRTPLFIVLCNSAQHLSFFLGCFLGHSLINGQRRFFDEAWKLRVKLLERRCDQLQAEKERADYDRQLVQHAVNQRMNELKGGRDDEEMSGVSRLSSKTPPNASNASSPMLTRRSVALPEALTDGVPQGCAAPNDGDAIKSSTAPDLTLAPTCGALPRESSIPPPCSTSGKSASSAGWSELNRLIGDTRLVMENPNAAAGSDRDGAESPATLNPNAHEWAPPQTGASDANDRT